MPRFLISFDDGSMDAIPDEDWPSVSEAAHAVPREAKAVVGGLTIIEVPTRDDARAWTPGWWWALLDSNQ